MKAYWWIIESITYQTIWCCRIDEELGNHTFLADEFQQREIDRRMLVNLPKKFSSLPIFTSKNIALNRTAVWLLKTYNFWFIDGARYVDCTSSICREITYPRCQTRRWLAWWKPHANAHAVSWCACQSRTPVCPSIGSFGCSVNWPTWTKHM